MQAVYGPSPGNLLRRRQLPRTSALLLGAFVCTLQVNAATGQTAHTVFRVACLRVEPRAWETEHNFRLLEKYSRAAAAAGADLIVTCEGFLTGYISNPNWAPNFSRERFFRHGVSMEDPWLKRVAALAAELQVHICVGFAERSGAHMHNSVAVYSPEGECVLHYAKTHTAGEPFSTPGEQFPVAHTKLGTLGTQICYDRRFPEVSRILALKGAQVLLIPAFGNDGERNEALLRTRAWENSVWVIYVKQNQALVIKPSGKIVARDQGKGDELMFANIEIDDNVGTGDILKRRAPDIYRELLEINTTTTP